MSTAALKLTSYFEERDRAAGRLMADALFDLYERHRMHTSVLLRGVQGFGQHHQLHSDQSLTLSESLPVTSIAVDTRERIELALPELLGIARHGLITVERARLLGDDADLGVGGDAQVKLTMYGGRSVRSAGHAGYVAALELLRHSGADLASVLLGVDGTLHGERRRARFFARNASIPLILVAIGGERPLRTALPALTGLISEPIVTIERVRICKCDGERRFDPWEVPDRDEAGLPIWQKLTVHCEEQSSYRGRPLYAELVRALSQAGAAGATAIRSVRGFHGRRAPIADRMLALRRNVPVQVVAIDRRESFERWWPIVDELTAESGLVTSELVPASRALSAGGEPGLALASTPRAGPNPRGS